MAGQTELQKLKRQFLEYIEIEKGRALKTVENYDRYLSRFLVQAKVARPEQISADCTPPRLFSAMPISQPSKFILMSPTNIFVTPTNAFTLENKTYCTETSG